MLNPLPATAPVAVSPGLPADTVAVDPTPALNPLPATAPVAVSPGLPADTVAVDPTPVLNPLPATAPVAVSPGLPADTVAVDPTPALNPLPATAPVAVSPGLPADTVAVDPTPVLNPLPATAPVAVSPGLPADTVAVDPTPVLNPLPATAPVAVSPGLPADTVAVDPTPALNPLPATAPVAVSPGLPADTVAVDQAPALNPLPGAAAVAVSSELLADTGVVDHVTMLDPLPTTAPVASAAADHMATLPAAPIGGAVSSTLQTDISAVGQVPVTNQTSTMSTLTVATPAIVEPADHVEVSAEASVPSAATTAIPANNDSTEQATAMIPIPIIGPIAQSELSGGGNNAHSSHSNTITESGGPMPTNHQGNDVEKASGHIVAITFRPDYEAGRYGNYDEQTSGEAPPVQIDEMGVGKFGNWVGLAVADFTLPYLTHAETVPYDFIHNTQTSQYTDHHGIEIDSHLLPGFDQQIASQETHTPNINHLGNEALSFDDGLPHVFDGYYNSSHLDGS